MGLDIALLFTIFIAGLVSFFSPCVLPLIPVYASILMQDKNGKQFKIFNITINLLPLIKTLLFIFGISTIFFFLAFFANFLGSILYNKNIRIIFGLIIILLGLNQMELLNINFLKINKNINLKSNNDLLNSYLLGISFSFGWTPCIGPILSSVLILISSNNVSIFQGVFLLIIYILGLSIPFLLICILSDIVIKYFNFAKKHLLTIKKIGGIIIVLMGILFILERV